MRRDEQQATRSGGLSTRAVHAGAPPRRPDGPVVNPVVSSATFYNRMPPEGEIRYTRYGTNPTHTALARKLASLDGGEAALPVGSGMAAAALTLLGLVEGGDHVVAARALYGRTAVLLRDDLARFGVEADFAETDGDWDALARPTTRVFLVEAISNPTLRVADLPELASRARRHGVSLVVDATFATPVNLRPLEHGADVVIHSATKYLGGHSDLVAGTIAGSTEFIETARARLKSFGASLDPHAAWLLERGLKTLTVRVDRQNANAGALARWLDAHPAVDHVAYPGLESHPDHTVATRLLDGFGGMLAFAVRGGDDAAVRVLDRLRLLAVAPSLGGVETLVSMPRFTSHVGLSADERRAAGIADGLIRVSVGIEDVEDLEADLDRALAPESP